MDSAILSLTEARVALRQAKCPIFESKVTEHYFNKREESILLKVKITV